MIITSQGLGKGLDPVFHRIEAGTSVAPFNSQKSESQENEMRAICQRCDISKVVCHRDANAMQDFFISALRELSPVMVRFYSVFQAGIAGIWRGMLTGQKKHRIVNAVIVLFYRLGRIIGIMGRVSYLLRWRVAYEI